jgi:hypothetical protein
MTYTNTYIYVIYIYVICNVCVVTAQQYQCIYGRRQDVEGRSLVQLSRSLAPRSFIRLLSSVDYRLYCLALHHLQLNVPPQLQTPQDHSVGGAGVARAVGHEGGGVAVPHPRVVQSSAKLRAPFASVAPCQLERPLSTDPSFQLD